MKISKTSWHFRYLRWWADPFASRVFRGEGLSTSDIAKFESKLPKSLCGYFWFLVAHMTVLPALFLTFCLFIAALGLVIAPFVGIYYGLCWIERVLSRRPKTVVPPREPGLIAAYLEAQKRKVCPLITYTEDAG